MLLALAFTRRSWEPMAQQTIVTDLEITAPESGSEVARPLNVPLTSTAKFFGYENYVRLTPCMLQTFGVSGEG
ncbi:hypothetical protein ES708_32667 [subsurface metagenome]